MHMKIGTDKALSKMMEKMRCRIDLVALPSFGMTCSCNSFLFTRTIGTVKNAVDSLLPAYFVDF